MWGQGDAGSAAAAPRDCCPLPWQGRGRPGRAGVSALRLLPADSKLRSASGCPCGEQRGSLRCRRRKWDPKLPALPAQAAPQAPTPLLRAGQLKLCPLGHCAHSGVEPSSGGASCPLSPWSRGTCKRVQYCCAFAQLSHCSLPLPPSTSPAPRCQASFSTHTTRLSSKAESHPQSC